MAIREILQLGNPKLYERCGPVTEGELPEIRQVIDDLHDTMMEFRRQYGRGRAIAAPQIGVMKRIVYMHIDKSIAFINPKLEGFSDEQIAIWDDCMSFPDLLVRVRRHARCTTRFRDLSWTEHSMELEGDLAELLQHECDHLDGILAIQRAIDDRSIILRTELGSQSSE